MKNILMSIQPKWVEKILNGEKTIEVRKHFPKDFRGWVYIYCTKAKPYLANGVNLLTKKYKCLEDDEDIYGKLKLNGKVVARFWCDRVMDTCVQEAQDGKLYSLILHQSCLTDEELWDYCDNQTFHAIHISKLEVYDRPLELSEFDVKRSPQSWQYIGGIKK